MAATSTAVVALGATTVTTPQTRPPQISVRPTHRPAFPNQPGSG